MDSRGPWQEARCGGCCVSRRISESESKQDDRRRELATPKQLGSGTFPKVPYAEGLLPRVVLLGAWGTFKRFFSIAGDMSLEGTIESCVSPGLAER